MSIELVTICRKRPGRKLPPQSFTTLLIAGLPSFSFTNYLTGLHNTQKENMLNMCSKQDFISITSLILVALIFKAIRNLFQTFNLDDSICVT